MTSPGARGPAALPHRGRARRSLVTILSGARRRRHPARRQVGRGPGRSRALRIRASASASRHPSGYGPSPNPARRASAGIDARTVPAGPRGPRCDRDRRGTRSGLPFSGLRATRTRPDLPGSAASDNGSYVNLRVFEPVFRAVPACPVRCFRARAGLVRARPLRRSVVRCKPVARPQRVLETRIDRPAVPVRAGPVCSGGARPPGFSRPIRAGRPAGARRRSAAGRRGFLRAPRSTGPAARWSSGTRAAG